MRLWGAKRRDTLELTVAAQPPVDAAIFAVVLVFAALLALAGIDLPPRWFPFLIPMGVGIAAMWVVGKLGRHRNVDVFDGPDGRELGYWNGHLAERVSMAELASVSREEEGEPPALTLSDLRGATVTIPLGTWTNEERLLEEVEGAATAAGASGTVGSPVPVHRPPWIVPSRIALGIVSFLAIAFLVLEAPQEEPVERVTPDRIEEIQGTSIAPFTQSNPCAVYVVPLDRPSEERANDIARALTRFPVLPCALRSLALDTSALDLERGQLDAAILAGKLNEQFASVWSDRPSTVIGITEHDLYSSEAPSLRFVFGFSFGNPDLQGFGVVSTARMGSGEDRMRRLETMVVRYVGLQFFGLKTSDEPRSALYDTIDGRGDLDRMRPELGDPPLSQIDLRQERARYLASG